MSFQTSVNRNVPLGFVGARASIYPITEVSQGNEPLRSGEQGVNSGRFVWVDLNGVVRNQGEGEPDGFLYRACQGVIMNWLEESSLRLLQGMGVNVARSGEFWVQTPEELGQVERGSAVYVNPKDGSVISAETVDAIKTRFFYDAPITGGVIAKISSRNGI